MNLLCMIAASGLLIADSTEPAPPPALEVESVLITLLDQIEVPAPEPGVLSIVAIKVGDKVHARKPLARIDDTRVKLLRDQAKVALSTAQRRAANDLKVQIARKQHELAELELKRATTTAERVEGAVSQMQIDRLTLEQEKAVLEIDQAAYENGTAQLAVDAKETELRIAEHDLIRHTILSPLDGVVVDVYRKQGEWVEGGQAVARIIRMDRVRAEGFIPAAQATDDVAGRQVRVTVKFAEDDTAEFQGVIKFVSPEIHPVNGKVRIWAEVENKAGRLRPGLPATMTIAP